MNNNTDDLLSKPSIRIIARVHMSVFLFFLGFGTLLIISINSRDVWYMSSISYGVLALTVFGQWIMKRFAQHIDSSHRTVFTTFIMTVLWILRWLALLWLWMWIGFSGMAP